MTKETIAVVDFGGQYAQLIARRIRDQHVHSVLVGPKVSTVELQKLGTAGIILSGGPASVYADGAPRCSPDLLEMNVPVLGICYGMQLGCLLLGSKVEETAAREFGRTALNVTGKDPLLAHVPKETNVWMSHGDVVSELPGEFVSLAKTKSCPFAAVKHKSRAFYGVQFHPEVTHTPQGEQILRNFAYDICGCKGDWLIANVIEESIARIREKVGENERVICGLSGGVDSSVVAALLHEAVGDRLVCIYVDNGLMRAGETDLVDATFREHFKIDLRIAREEERFLSALEGVTDPTQKRKIIGREFIEVFQAEAESVENAKYLAQGTLYPDVIESGKSVGGGAAKIKLHHNVGGLPEKLGFELIEPLRNLFKDEVRRVGLHMGLPEQIVWRHPFPGPGLAVRIIGEVTQERLDILRKMDTIVIEEIKAAGWYRKIGQAFAVLIPVKTVGVMGDSQSYAGQHVGAIRFVETTDFMTADWVHCDYELLGRIASRTINEVKGINRVVYDVSSKPPATIEWE